MISSILLGSIVACSVIASLFFLRYWRSSRDRFFLFFAAAFLLDAVNRLALSETLRSLSPTAEHAFYLLRLLSYGLILIAILDKNRRNKEKP